jgi:hypothetical protein
MSKRKQARSYPHDDAPQPKVELTGIAKAAEDLSEAVKDFDRQAASWSSKGELVRT